MILTRGFSVPVRPQLRLRVDRQFEAATSGERRLCGDLRHEPNEPHRRFLGICATRFARKKNTMFERSSAARSCGRVLMCKSAVMTAHPPSSSSAVIQSTSVVFSGNLSRLAMT